MKKITKVIHNWYPPHNTQDLPEGFDTVEAGVNGCFSIVEHLPAGEGDRLYYTAHYQDGTEIRIFNPNTVISN